MFSSSSSSSSESKKPAQATDDLRDILLKLTSCKDLPGDWKPEEEWKSDDSSGSLQYKFVTTFSDLYHHTKSALNAIFHLPIHINQFNFLKTKGNSCAIYRIVISEDGLYELLEDPLAKKLIAKHANVDPAAIVAKRIKKSLSPDTSSNSFPSETVSILTKETVIPKPTASFLTAHKLPSIVLDEKKELIPFNEDNYLKSYSDFVQIYIEQGKEALLKRCHDENLFYAILDEYKEGSTLLGGACDIGTIDDSDINIPFFDFLLNETDLIQAYKSKDLHYLILAIVTYFGIDFNRNVVVKKTFYGPTGIYPEEFDEKIVSARLDKRLHILSQLAKKGVCSAALEYEEKELLNSCHHQYESDRNYSHEDPKEYDYTIVGMAVAILDNIINPTHNIGIGFRNQAIELLCILFNSGLNQAFLIQLGARTSLWEDNKYKSYSHSPFMMSYKKHSEYKEKAKKERIAFFQDLDVEAKLDIQPQRAKKLKEFASTPSKNFTLSFFSTTIIPIVASYLDPSAKPEPARKNSQFISL